MRGVACRPWQFSRVRRLASGMIVRHLNASDLGKTVTLPTLAALGRCRSGTLHSITLETTTDTSTLRIGDHLHSVPNDATVYVTTEVSGL